VEFPETVEHVRVVAASSDIAGEHGRSVDGKVPDLPLGEIVPTSGVVDSHGLDVLIGQALADGAGPRMVGKASRACAGALSEPVALDKRNAGVRLEVFAHRGG